MNPALWVAKTGLDAQQTRMSVISNNLANTNTNGFKKDRARFEDLIYQTVRQAGASSSSSTQVNSGLNLGTGVRILATEKQHGQGNIVHTEGALDMAISGRGYFQVSMPDGTIAYSRDGAFQVDDSGQIVTANGYPLEPSITIPAQTTSITVGSDGTISATVYGSSTPTVVGSLTIADFMNVSGLQPIGENLFRETAASGSATVATPGTNGLGNIIAGALESSNVNIAEEMVNMIETQRAYETNAKAISAVDQMLQYANNNI